MRTPGNRWHDCFLPEDYWKRVRRQFSECDAGDGRCAGTPETAGRRPGDELDREELRLEDGVMRRMDDVEFEGWDISR